LKERALEAFTSALEARDPATRSHCERVSELASRLAKQLDLAPLEVADLVIACGLHDFGVIDVPDRLLHKPGPLTPAEWEVMKRHPDVGADLVGTVRVFAGAAVLMRHHHERWDGSGYPGGLKGERIPMGARIIAVAESFDFITHKWPYRANPLNDLQAEQDISKHASSWYDPAVVDALLARYD